MAKLDSEKPKKILILRRKKFCKIDSWIKPDHQKLVPIQDVLSCGRKDGCIRNRRIGTRSTLASEAMDRDPRDIPVQVFSITLEST